MIEFLFQPFAFLEAFILIFIRLFGMLITAPIFRNRNVPYIVKIGFVFLLTNILITSVPISSDISIEKSLVFAFIMLKELFIGIVIGFAAYLVFSILTMVGQFIDMQMGFSMVSMFDPLNRVQITVTANLYTYVFTLILLATNFHHFILRALVESFELIPLGSYIYNPALVNNFVDYMSRFFILTMTFAAPIVFVTLITNVVLGILARVVPSLNMFVIGFPLKIFFGIVTILIMFTVFSSMSDILIDDSKKMIRDALLYLQGVAD